MKTYVLNDIDWSKALSTSGFSKWSSPSNLAIVKYWGKWGNQMPCNPSISLTLSNARTITSVNWKLRNEEEQMVVFYFHEEEKPSFIPKIEKFWAKLDEIFPFLKDIHCEIRSENTFPHSSGIASSASSMSALALCLCSIESQITGNKYNERDFLEKASFIARLGSGSACRSVFPYWVEWGQSHQHPHFSDRTSEPLENVHLNFMNVQDTILLVSSEEKSVSSTAGHQLMEDNVYAEVRYTQAKKHMNQLYKVLQTGDWEAFGKIAENEALTLHALMMSSEESYILLKPNSLKIIEEVRAYRRQSGHHVYFSLDAGPNIHLLYPEDIKSQIHAFIDKNLMKYCEQDGILYDQIGNGPVKLT